MSYFIGRDANIGRGVLTYVQIAVLCVIAMVGIVWLADIILRGNTGMSLGDVPGVRAAIFLIVAAIGLSMLYLAFEIFDEACDSNSIGRTTRKDTIVTIKSGKPVPMGNSKTRTGGLRQHADVTQ